MKTSLEIQLLILMGVAVLLTNCTEKKEVALGVTLDVETISIEVSKAQFAANNMALGKPKNESMAEVVNATGMIDVPPYNRAVVNARMGGFIKKTPFLVGDKVTEGQFLVSIENPEFIKLQQNYLEIKSQLSYLQMEYQRQKQLFSENITSQKNYLKAESEFQTAKASANGFKKQLEMLNFSITQIETGQLSAVTNIYAPIAGTISKMNVAMGSFVADASVILEIVDTKHLHLELNVFEKDILKLKKGQRIQFEIPESSNDSFEAEVHLIGASIEPNRTIKVHGHLKNEEGHNFLPGMFVEAAIELDSKTVMVLPEAAVVIIGENHFVLRLATTTDNQFSFEKQQVEIGKSTRGFTEVKSGIDLDVDYLLNGASNLILN